MSYTRISSSEKKNCTEKMLYLSRVKISMRSQLLTSLTCLNAEWAKIGKNNSPFGNRNRNFLRNFRSLRKCSVDVRKHLHVRFGQSSRNLQKPSGKWWEIIRKPSKTFIYIMSKLLHGCLEISSFYLHISYPKLDIFVTLRASMHCSLFIALKTRSVAFWESSGMHVFFLNIYKLKLILWNALF